jgi:Leucine-rich repeat (LRR) protein
LHHVVSLEGFANTTESSLTDLRDLFPNLEKLTLNRSVIPSFRDIGCNFRKLRVLSLEGCSISSLNGISTLSPCLEELYLGNNDIEDISDVMGIERLRVLHLGNNRICDMASLGFLSCCENLRVLTLSGNVVAVRNPREYKKAVLDIIPQLELLDAKDPKPEMPPPPSHAPIRRQIASGAKQSKDAPDIIAEPSGEGDQMVMTEQLCDFIQIRPPSADEFSYEEALGELDIQSSRSSAKGRAAIVRPKVPARRGPRPASTIGDRQA